MGEVVDAIQPVITKCKPGDDDADIDVIRELVGAQLAQELKNLKSLMDIEEGDEAYIEQEKFFK